MERMNCSKRLMILTLAVSLMMGTCSCSSEKMAIGSSNVTQTATTKDPYDVPPSETSEDYPYSYTIGKSWAYPLVIVLPVDVESYVTIEDSVKKFDVQKLASDYGWKEQDGYFYFDAGDLWVRMDFEHGVLQKKDATGKDVFFGGKYRFVKAGKPDAPYYEFDPVVSKSTNDLEWHFYDPEEEPVDYVIDLDSSVYSSFDELVLLTYLFTHVSVEPTYSPFFYYPEYNVRHESESKELKEARKAERYTF